MTMSSFGDLQKMSFIAIPLFYIDLRSKRGPCVWQATFVKKTFKQVSMISGISERRFFPNHNYNPRWVWTSWARPNIAAGAASYRPCRRRRTRVGRARAAVCLGARRLLLLTLTMLLMMMMMMMTAASRDTWSRCRRTASLQSRDRSYSSWSCNNNTVDALLTTDTSPHRTHDDTIITKTVIIIIIIIAIQHDRIAIVPRKDCSLVQLYTAQMTPIRLFRAVKI